jgi:deoxyribodipyrimidine photo-lyase
MNNAKQDFALFWFRRDLRIEDNHGLFSALASGLPVLPVFIFDRNILDKLEDKTDARLHFIHSQLGRLHNHLLKFSSGIRFFHSTPEEAFTDLIWEGNLKVVFTNGDYEPYARERDENVATLLEKAGIPFHSFKDQVIFEKDEVLTGARQPYTVFTPYANRWKGLVNETVLAAHPSESLQSKFLKWQAKLIPPLGQLGFSESTIPFPEMKVSDELIRAYQEKRDFPSLPATSRLSTHLRFGTISIRSLVRRALPLSETWLNELIWREFYMQILWNFPRVGEGKSFKPAYDQIEWRNNAEEFQRWCEGKTGYPIVDAGMRELNATGFMHNRARMITASFLVKHLLIDWRWGEAYFARKLLDFDLAANNGGWQWSASSGCDAAPYFRVFNPTLQAGKFDKDFAYIKKWVPEFNHLSYIQNPVVKHEFARKRVLDVYKKALGQEE